MLDEELYEDENFIENEKEKLNTFSGILYAQDVYWYIDDVLREEGVNMCKNSLHNFLTMFFDVDELYPNDSEYESEDENIHSDDESSSYNYL